MTNNKKDFLLENHMTKTLYGTREERDEAMKSELYIKSNYWGSVQDNIEYEMFDEDIPHEYIVEEALFAINKKAKITMYCSIFFVVITLISMITTFVFTYKISKVTEVFDGIYSYDTDYDYWD